MEAASWEECSSNRTRSGAASEGDSSRSAEADFMGDTQRIVARMMLERWQRIVAKALERQIQKKQWSRKAKAQGERKEREAQHSADFPDPSGT